MELDTATGTCLPEDEQQNLVENPAAGDLEGGFRVSLRVAVVASHTISLQELTHGAHAGFLLRRCAPLLHQFASEVQGT